MKETTPTFFIYYLIKFQNTIRQTETVFLVLTGVFLGGSVFFDFIETIIYPDDKHIDPYFLLLEEGNKLMGIASWCAYVVTTCFQKITDHKYKI
ncbi:hypothetical protein IQ264_18630 [Phormidium sp. LEGE 05292]|uniref:hypothetical protein n=1 Tax=[Phormidium] sp. LEGE 05292 TaxID=767427 RepID=UPI0018827302|nr:hypothetical protein [Phormidium sp. LEGE 05292]MBE9227447.1 hypothetical protein [Phormidium sp. LEGE 05292]